MNRYCKFFYSFRLLILKYFNFITYFGKIFQQGAYIKKYCTSYYKPTLTS